MASARRVVSQWRSVFNFVTKTKLGQICEPHFVRSSLGNAHLRYAHDKTTQPTSASSTPNASEIKSKSENEPDLFSPENLEGISPTEIARMRVAYGLVREHAEVVEKNKSPLSPESNPMIDPRSFDVRTLPQLPKEVLESFRSELPPKEAAHVRPVSTLSVWEDAGSKKRDVVSELASQSEAEWSAVDERTMDPRQFSRMRRLSILSQDSPSQKNAAFSAPVPTLRRRKKKCVLKDERGRVNIDFRSLGVLNAFVSEGGKILGRRKSGLSAKAQRKVSRSIKAARQMALISPKPRVGLTYEEMLQIESELP